MYLSLRTILHNIVKQSWHYGLILALVCASNEVHAQTKINRQEVVSRHMIKLTAIDTLSSLSVGNGRFAFKVDVTGLQNFTEYYIK